VADCDAATGDETTYRIYDSTSDVNNECQNVDGDPTDPYICSLYEKGGKSGPNSCASGPPTYNTFSVPPNGATVKCSFYDQADCSTGAGTLLGQVHMFGEGNCAKYSGFSSFQCVRSTL